MPGFPLRNPDHLFCGTYSSYVRRGCRCDDCRIAARNVQRKRRGQPPVSTHDRYQLPVGEAPGGWVDQAACKGMNTNEFFPEVGGTGAVPAVVDKVCKGCPVRRDCLDFALRNKIEYGCWGGLSAKQRKVIRRKWREDVA